MALQVPPQVMVPPQVLVWPMLLGAEIIEQALP